MRSDLKKLDSLTLETSKSTSSAIFCATGAWGFILDYKIWSLYFLSLTMLRFNKKNWIILKWTGSSPFSQYNLSNFKPGRKTLRIILSRHLTKILFIGSMLWSQQCFAVTRITTNFCFNIFAKIFVTNKNLTLIQKLSYSTNYSKSISKLYITFTLKYLPYNNTSTIV